jgi:hypothetical protein
MCCDCLSRLNRCTTYVLLRKKQWLFVFWSIWNSFSGFVMESCYSAREMADMHFMYGRASWNSQEARRLCAEHYPQRSIPSHKLVTKLHQLLSKSRSFAPRASDRGRPRSVWTRIEKSGRKSRNQCAKSCSCWRYRCSPFVDNSPWTITLPITNPASARAVFCQRLLAKCVLNTQFVANILFTVEAGFTRDGIVNFHNMHVSVDDNTHITVASRHHHYFPSMFVSDS